MGTGGKFANQGERPRGADCGCVRDGVGSRQTGRSSPSPPSARRVRPEGPGGMAARGRHRPGGATRGRGAEGSRRPRCAAPSIFVARPRGRLILDRLRTIPLTLPPAPPARPPPWLCSRDPVVPRPCPALTAPALCSHRSFSRGRRRRRRLSFPQPWSE